MRWQFGIYSTPYNQRRSGVAHLRDIAVSLALIPPTYNQRRFGAAHLRDIAVSLATLVIPSQQHRISQPFVEEEDVGSQTTAWVNWGDTLLKRIQDVLAYQQGKGTVDKRLVKAHYQLEEALLRGRVRECAKAQSLYLNGVSGSKASH